jgi:hypothetical protein
MRWQPNLRQIVIGLFSNFVACAMMNFLKNFLTKWDEAVAFVMM